jgi:hypothetical protein
MSGPICNLHFSFFNFQFPDQRGRATLPDLLLFRGHLKFQPTGVPEDLDGNAILSCLLDAGPAKSEISPLLVPELYSQGHI